MRPILLPLALVSLCAAGVSAQNMAQPATTAGMNGGGMNDPTMRLSTGNGGGATATTSSTGTVLSTVDGGDTDAMVLDAQDAATQQQQQPSLPKSLLQTFELQELPEGEWHMKPVRAIHARVQSDAPMLHPSNNQFISRLGANDFATGYFAGMDGVNTASVEGALMYVQAEGINYNTRSPDQQCQRKNDMKYIVFYEVVVAQTNETLALYQDTADQNEYGPMVPIDQGRCSPTGTKAGQDVLPKECYYFNGDDGEPNLGPFVGGESKALDVRAPYPENIWFSLPNTCPLKVWAEKTPECRASTRKGLCDYGVLPDGIHCTFAYSILGYIPIDDVVGITSMGNSQTGLPYTNFAEFCKAGGVEFKAEQDGKWEESLPFWQDPQNDTVNAVRAAHLIAAYQNLTSGFGASSQVDPSLVMYMRPLPSVEELASENPLCYENVIKCSGGSDISCRRETFSQVCRVCDGLSGDNSRCEVAPREFKFPKLQKAVGEDGGQGDADPSAKKEDRKPKKKKTESQAASREFSLIAGLAMAMVVVVVVV